MLEIITVILILIALIDLAILNVVIIRILYLAKPEIKETEKFLKPNVDFENKSDEKYETIEAPTKPEKKGEIVYG